MSNILSIRRVPTVQHMPFSVGIVVPASPICDEYSMALQIWAVSAEGAKEIVRRDLPGVKIVDVVAVPYPSPTLVLEPHPRLIHIGERRHTASKLAHAIETSGGVHES